MHILIREASPVRTFICPSRFVTTSAARAQGGLQVSLLKINTFSDENYNTSLLLLIIVAFGEPFPLVSSFLSSVFTRIIPRVALLMTFYPTIPTMMPYDDSVRRSRCARDHVQDEGSVAIATTHDTILSVGAAPDWDMHLVCGR